MGKKSMNDLLFSVWRKIQGPAVAIVVFAALFSVMYNVHYAASEAVRSEINSNIIDAGKMISTLITPQDHDSFIEPPHVNSKYEELAEVITRFVHSSSLLDNVYTTIQVNNKTLFVLLTKSITVEELDAMDDPLKAIDPMDEYTDVNEDLLRAFRSGEVIISDTPYTDDWGSFISAYIPLKDSDGRLYAVLGIDVSADNYHKEMESVNNIVKVGLWVSLIIAAIVSWLLMLLQCVYQKIDQFEGRDRRQHAR